MALDVPYTIQLAKIARQYGVKWIEEPVLPDKIDSYRRIKDAVPDIMITVENTSLHVMGLKSCSKNRRLI